MQLTRWTPPRWRCTLVVVNVPSHATYTLDPSPVEVHSCCSQCAVTSNLHAGPSPVEVHSCCSQCAVTCNLHAGPLPGGGALLLLSMCRHVQLTRWTPLRWRCTLVVVNVPSHATYTLDPSPVEVHSCCSQCAVTSNLHAGPSPV